MARRKGTNTGIPGLSFSWKRAVGVTNAKRKISKITGIPTTRSGRQRKIGGMITGRGCIIPILFVCAVVTTIALMIV